MNRWCHRGASPCARVRAIGAPAFSESAASAAARPPSGVDDGLDLTRPGRRAAPTSTSNAWNDVSRWAPARRGGERRWRSPCFDARTNTARAPASDEDVRDGAVRRRRAGGGIRATRDEYPCDTPRMRPVGERAARHRTRVRATVGGAPEHGTDGGDGVACRDGGERTTAGMPRGVSHLASRNGDVPERGAPIARRGRTTTWRSLTGGGDGGAPRNGGPRGKAALDDAADTLTPRRRRAAGHEGGCGRGGGRRGRRRGGGDARGRLRERRRRRERSEMPRAVPLAAAMSAAYCVDQASAGARRGRRGRRGPDVAAVGEGEGHGVAAVKRAPVTRATARPVAPSTVG